MAMTHALRGRSTKDYMTPLGLTPNAWLAFLSEVGKMSMSALTVSVIVQLKYLWFDGENRPMYDFQRYDNAVQGLQGSFMLVFHRRVG
jgi:hypothetical protein